MSRILLTTLNARYSHTSFGLRCLLANLGDLRASTELVEFTINDQINDVLAEIVRRQPTIVGIGVYIWNVEPVTRLLADLRRVLPDAWLVLGGPEVSYETDQQAVTALADYVITGWGDVSFPKLARDILDGRPPAGKVITGEQLPLSRLALPYTQYTDEDIARRFIYVEASRGCPFNSKNTVREPSGCASLVVMNLMISVLPSSIETVISSPFFMPKKNCGVGSASKSP